MKTNNVLTYLLYALLLGLIAAAGYKACQMKKDKELQQQKQEAELQQALHDMGYNHQDSTASTGSSYTDHSTTGNTNNSSVGVNTKTGATKNGIEDMPPSSSSSKQVSSPASSLTDSKNSKAGKPQASTQSKSLVTKDSPTTANKAPKLKAAAKPTKATTAKKTLTTKKAATATTGKKLKYRVQAGSFSRVEGARERLKEVIKMGYPNAEIGKSGQYSVVVVMRTNDRAAAIKVVDKLEAKGMDAAIMENK